MAPSKKQVKTLIKLQVAAGAANPAPPVGPVLGQHGLNIQDFCKSFNEKTSGHEKGIKLPVVITVYSDRSFTFEIKQPPASVLLKKALGVDKGSATPNSVKVGKLTLEQLQKVAQSKMPDLSAADLAAAVRTLAGTARSMGIETEV